LNGAPSTRYFHPFHDAMRLWWLLEFAIIASRQHRLIFNGEQSPWPWRTIGPIGLGLAAALETHGVQPVPRNGCSACAKLRLTNASIAPWGTQSYHFLSLPRATHAVWHAMQTDCLQEVSSTPPLLWWRAAGVAHVRRHSLQLPTSAASRADDWPQLGSRRSDDRLVLLDRMPPRQLQIHGEVRRPMLRETISGNDTCATVRQWSLPAFAYVTPHGAQLNNRFLMTQQSQPCLIEAFPLGYFTPCYVLPFCPQRHIQVYGSHVWDAHRRQQSAEWKLVAADILERCDKWFPPPPSGEELRGQEKKREKKRQYNCRAKARSQIVEISNSTLEAAVELCHRAVVPSQCGVKGNA
jgi:hypothetical protein